MNVPGFSTLNAFLLDDCTLVFFNSMERFILKYFNWNVGM